jgi:hypothetical protein
MVWTHHPLHHAISVRVDASALPKYSNKAFCKFDGAGQKYVQDVTIWPTRECIPGPNIQPARNTSRGACCTWEIENVVAQHFVLPGNRAEFSQAWPSTCAWPPMYNEPSCRFRGHKLQCRLDSKHPVGDWRPDRPQLPGAVLVIEGVT